MTNNELQSMVNAAQGGKSQPTPQVWDRLESRLDSDFKDKKIKLLTLQKKLLAIASCLLIATVAVIGFSTQQSVNDSFEQSSLAKTQQTPSNLYDVHNVRKLNRIYN